MSSVWPLKPLKEVFDVKGGKRMPKGERFEDIPTPYRYIRVTNFNNGTVDTNDIKYISEKIYNSIKRYTITSNDLYISVAGTLGLVGTIPEKLSGANLTENANKLMPLNKEKTDIQFYKYFLNSDFVQSQITQQKGTGGGVPKLAVHRIQDLEIAQPDIHEQSKIAKILRSVDKAIELIEIEIEKLKNLKKGVMQDLFTEGIGHTKFKSSHLGKTPHNWEAVTLGDLVSKESPICYGILMPGKNVKNGIPVLKVRDMNGTGLNQNELLLTDPKIDDQYKRSRLETGDILLSIRGTTGRMAIIPKSLNNANITQDSARIRITATDKVISKFVYFMMLGECLQFQIKMNTIGLAVKGINLAEVRKLLLPLPPLSEQKKIVAILENELSLIELKKKKLVKMKDMKKGLMQDLLTGKVRVKV